MKGKKPGAKPPEPSPKLKAQKTVKPAIKPKPDDPTRGRNRVTSKGR